MLAAYGRNSDGGVFGHCSLGSAMDRKKVSLPPEAYLPKGQYSGKMPFVIVADKAFP